MRKIVSALLMGIAIGCAAGTGALANECQTGDPYKKPEFVIDACSKLLDASGSDSGEKLDALRQRAEAYYWANRYDFAIADLDAALALDRDSVETLRRRGWTNLQLNRRREASSDFTQALNLDEQNADTLFAIGFMLHQEGSADAARTAYEQALAINPKLYLAKGNLADLYFYAFNDAEKAFEQLDAILAADPIEIAKVRYNSFRTSGGVSDYSVVARLGRAQMLFHLRRLEPALADTNWIIEKYPGAAAALALRADIRRHLRDDANALADADRVLTLSPDDERAQIVKLNSLSRLGRREELGEFATRVIESPATENARGNAYFYRAEVEKSRNDRAAAIADMERSFELAPFFLVATLQRMIARGYYEGTQDDGYGKKARVALEACMIDPEC